MRDWLLGALVATLIVLEVAHRARPMPWYERIRAPFAMAVAGLLAVGLLLLGIRKPATKDLKAPEFEDAGHTETDAKADDTDLKVISGNREGDALSARASDRDAKLAELRARAERLRGGEGDRQ